MSALDDLIAAVEAGEVATSRDAIHAMSVWQPVGASNADKARHAYHGSLDAAKVLHEALLPGWEYNATSAFCLVYPIAAPEDEGIISGYADNPARSWLLAILRAYRSLQEKPE